MNFFLTYISDFSLFFMWKLQPPLKKFTPLFPSNPPLFYWKHYVHYSIHLILYNYNLLELYGRSSSLRRKFYSKWKLPLRIFFSWLVFPCSRFPTHGMVFIRVFQNVLRKRIARWVHIQQKHDTVMTKVSIKTDRKDNLSFFKKQKILEAKVTNKIHRIITKKQKYSKQKLFRKNTT